MTREKPRRGQRGLCPRRPSPTQLPGLSRLGAAPTIQTPGARRERSDQPPSSPPPDPPPPSCRCSPNPDVAQGPGHSVLSSEALQENVSVIKRPVTPGTFGFGLSDQFASPELTGSKFLRGWLAARRPGGECGVLPPAAPGSAAGWVARVRVGLCLHARPEQQLRGPAAECSAQWTHVLSCAPGPLRDTLQTLPPQTWHSAGSLRAPGRASVQPPGRAHHAGLHVSPCTMFHNVCVWGRKCQGPRRHPHAQGQMQVRTPRVPGPSVPITEDVLSLMTKAS